jgi:hypothetical protein
MTADEQNRNFALGEMEAARCRTDELQLELAAVRQQFLDYRVAVAELVGQVHDRVVVRAPS